MRLAVVLDHVRVVDGRVGGLLVEVLDRIAALTHDLRDQLVGIGQRRSGLVDELGLRGLPALDVALARALVERLDVIAAPSVAALAQLGFSCTLVAVLVERAVVLRAKAFTQLRGLALPVQEHAHDHEQHDDDDHQNPDHVCPPLLMELRSCRSEWGCALGYPSAVTRMCIPSARVDATNSSQYRLPAGADLKGLRGELAHDRGREGVRDGAAAGGGGEKGHGGLV